MICACGYRGDLSFDLRWAISHKRVHLRKFPNVDDRTREILDEEIARKRREQTPFASRNA